MKRNAGTNSIKRIIVTNLLDSSDEEDEDDQIEENNNQAAQNYNLYYLEGSVDNSPNVLFSPPSRKRRVSILVDSEGDHSDTDGQEDS